MLADIGLTRADLYDVSSEPFWVDPTTTLQERAGRRCRDVSKCLSSTASSCCYAAEITADRAVALHGATRAASGRGAVTRNPDRGAAAAGLGPPLPPKAD
jgi:hypothetical protein